MDDLITTFGESDGRLLNSLEDDVPICSIEGSDNTQYRSYCLANGVLNLETSRNDKRLYTAESSKDFVWVTTTGRIIH